ncbi:MAG TPA: MFS transporter [Rhizomicrobium sp.]|nr:MFS transporter [Rhizomicrobium sp.]
MAARLRAAMDSTAFRFVLTLGVVNLFADITYEGGGSINGPFLGTLGASAALISIVAGLGEFLGYALRAVAGHVADRTGKYWPISFVGYAINLLAVPAMALAGSWQLAAVLMLAERIGRAIRKPTIETMLSYTTAKFGKGWVFAVNTALDETGATLGPLLMAAVLFLGGRYQMGYALLLISSLLALASLTAARIVFPVPANLGEGKSAPERDFTPAFWLYMAGGAFFAAGLMSYELISFHLVTAGLISPSWMPVALAFATGTGVIANLALGHMFDRVGMNVVLAAVILSAFFTPLIFSGSLIAVLIAMPLWGVGYAVQDTLFKALVADILPDRKRGLAFGLFYAGYGLGWLVGSVAVGLLYQRSHLALVLFAVAAQLCALPFFILGHRRQHAR